MLDQLRKQLTLLCIVITGTILAAISLFSFIFAEKQLNKRSILSLQSDVTSISEHVKNDHYVSHAWLNQLESSNKMVVSLCSKNGPFLFQGTYLSPEERKDLIAKTRQIGLNEHHFDAMTTYTTPYETPSVSFSLHTSSGHYIAMITTLTQTERRYELIVIKNMCDDDTEITILRLIFIGFVVFGIALLGLFSWWFAGKAIRPIKASRKEQIDFVAAASHELRSPVAVIQAVTEDMLDNEPPQNADSLHIIKDECGKLARLVGDLLLLARADSGKWSITKQPSEPDTLLLNVYEKYLPLAQKHHHKLDIKFSDTVYDPILIDRERIEQVLSILLDNAMSYTPPDTLILLKLEKAAKMLNIWVIDNGPGIPASARPYIFKRFYRADASRQDDKHTGLGLSIAYEIIKLHNGYLSLDSDHHPGCAFKITLPYPPVAQKKM